MMLKKMLVISIVIMVVFAANAEGLQCYVCEDCNEYQDFKELHICGEISISMTQKPITLPEVLGTNASTKPPPSDTAEEYVYDYSVEAHDDSGTSPGKDGNTTAATTASTTNPTTTTNTVSQEVQSTTTVLPTNASTVSTDTVSTTLKPAELPATTVSTDTVSTTLKPAQQPDEYDYMEYEDQRTFNIERLPKVAVGSLLKIDEPVCYMYRYYVNHTVITNRGCTSLLNANKFLTCQALSNGTPMVGCRVCSTDGCNKFDLDESGEDHLLNASVLNMYSTIFVTILAIVISIVV